MEDEYPDKLRIVYICSMTKVIKFQQAVPEKFGPQRVRTKKRPDLEKLGQLNLFTGGKVISLHALSPFEEALMAEEQGRLDSARHGYERAIELNDSKTDAYCNLGILEFQDGHYPKAIDCFTLCLKEEPRHFEAHYNLANLYSEVGNFALAKLHYQTSIEIEPEFANSYFNLGLNLAMNKSLAEAIQVLYQYKTLTPPEQHHQADELILKMKEML